MLRTSGALRSSPQLRKLKNRYPFVPILVNRQRFHARVDTGCTVTIMREDSAIRSLVLPMMFPDVEREREMKLLFAAYPDRIRNLVSMRHFVLGRIRGLEVDFDVLSHHGFTDDGFSPITQKWLKEHHNPSKPPAVSAKAKAGMTQSPSDSPASSRIIIDEVVVVKEAPFDFLIGNDVLCEHGMTVDCAANELHVSPAFRAKFMRQQ